MSLFVKKSPQMKQLKLRRIIGVFSSSMISELHHEQSLTFARFQLKKKISPFPFFFCVLATANVGKKLYFWHASTGDPLWGRSYQCLAVVSLNVHWGFFCFFCFFFPFILTVNTNKKRKRKEAFYCLLDCIYTQSHQEKKL